MSKPRLEQVQGAGKRWVDVEHGATKGARVGRDLYDSDGTLVTSLADLVRTSIARDTLRINGIPVEQIITKTGTLVVKEIAAEAIQAGDLTQVVNINGGGIQATAGGNTFEIGAGFGPDNLVLFYGPTPTPDAFANAAKANALIWFDNTGSAYFGGTLSTSKVTEQLAGRGANLLPDQYARLCNANGSLPVLQGAGTSVINASFDAATPLVAGDVGSMKVAVSDATGNVASSWIRFGASATDYNIRLPGGKKYIFSGQFRASVNGVALLPVIGDGGGASHNGAQLNLAAANTWARQSCVIDLTAYSGNAALLLIYFNRQGSTTAYTVWVDQLMIEEAVGNQTAPSAWVPGPIGRTVDGKVSHYRGSTPPYTSGGVVGDTWTDDDNLFQYRWDGASWVISASFTPITAGDNLVANHAFATNAIGTTAGANLGLTQRAGDGWTVTYDGSKTAGQSAQTFIAWHWASAANAGITCQVSKPTALANGALVASQVVSDTFPAFAGETYYTNFNATQQYNGTQPSGVVMRSRLQIEFLDSAGARVSLPTPNQVDRVGLSQAWAGEVAYVAPANTVAARVYLDSLVQNNSGAAFTHDNSVAMRTIFWDCYVTRKPELEKSGSGRRLGDTRNAPAIMVGNGSAKVPTAPSYTSVVGSATITVPAFTMLTGSVSVAYSAMSVGVSHAAGTVTYFLYCDDPGLKGGARTLVATTNGNACWQGDDRVYLGTIDVVFPASGTGGGSGSGGGSGGSCVDADAWVAEGLRARDVRVGDLVDVVDLPGSGCRVFQAEVTDVSLAWAERVRLVTEDGAELELAADTPLDLPALDGTWSGARTTAEEALGHLVLTDWGLERVAVVEPIGGGWVVRIRVNGLTYAAGSDPEHRIFSHNPLKP